MIETLRKHLDFSKVLFFTIFSTQKQNNNRTKQNQRVTLELLRSTSYKKKGNVSIQKKLMYITGISTCDILSGLDVILSLSLGL